MLYHKTCRFEYSIWKCMLWYINFNGASGDGYVKDELLCSLLTWNQGMIFSLLWIQKISNTILSHCNATLLIYQYCSLPERCIVTASLQWCQQSESWLGCSCCCSLAGRLRFPTHSDSDLEDQCTWWCSVCLACSLREILLCLCCGMSPQSMKA